jgi:Flp pilus assembly protein TadD
MGPRFILVLLFSSCLATAQERPPRSDDPPGRTERAPGESSSKETVIDLAPPKDDATHPGSDIDDEATAAATGVRETRPWNPHRAAKNVEVGDFYFRDKNYRAAVSRYREALEYKPKDAEATYKLAVALEKLGNPKEAAQFYREYLKISSEGIRTVEAKKGLKRLRAKSGIDAVAESESPMQAAEKLLLAKDFTAAAEAFRVVLRSEAPDADARYRLAQSLEGAGDINEALADYFKYLQSAPGGRFSGAASAAIERLKKQGATISRSSQTPQ